MTRHLRLLVLLLFAVPSAPLSAQQAASKEPESRKAIGAAWEGLATWCVRWKLKDEAREAADAALEADPENAKAKAAKAVTGASEGNEASKKEYAKKLEATKKQVAGLWKSIASEPHPEKEREKYDELWARALELDPKTTLPAHEAELKLAQSKLDWKRAARLLGQQDKVLPADPARAKQLHEFRARSSMEEPLLLKASTHEMRYFLSLPPSWTPDKTWPVLVACEGTGCNFKEQCTKFASFRGDVPVILLTPCTFSNSGGPVKDKHPWYSNELMDARTKNLMDFDEPGLMAALADVKRDWGGEEKFFIAGYSGGGILCWWEVFLRPTELRGAFPACANYVGVPEKVTPGGRDLPIRVFQGGDDEYLAMLTAAWGDVEKKLKKFQFTNYTRTILPGMPHQACHEAIFKEVDAILKK